MNRNRGRRRRCGRGAAVLACLVYTAFAGAQPADEPRDGEPAAEIRFLSPAPGEPLFGPTTVELAIDGESSVRSVVLRLDGMPVAQRSEPPWSFELDAGTSGAARGLEVLAYGDRGVLASARLDTPEVRIDEQVDLRLQQLYVTVTDRGGERVDDLPQALFRVFDGGEEQRLVTFERGEVPFTAVLLIDGSASMTGEPFAAARRGARAFLEGMGPLDEASVIVFSGQQLAATPFSADAERLAAAVDGARTRGGSAIHDHLYLALRRLEERQGRRVVILLSDGRDVASLLDAEHLRAAARRSQTQIFWVRRDGGGGRGLHSWRPPGEHRRQRRLLERIATESGGRALEIGDEAEVEPAFREILRELREQYVLGYYPPESPPGSWRPVRVELARRGLRARTVAGYPAR